jgi:hypothetical protein
MGWNELEGIETWGGLWEENDGYDLPRAGQPRDSIMEELEQSQPLRVVALHGTGVIRRLRKKVKRELHGTHFISFRQLLPSEISRSPQP